MATGPEHYREAQRLLDQAGEALRDSTIESRARVEAHRMLTSAAQVHATLALAAATLAATHADAVPSGTHADWWRVMGGAR